MNKVCLSCQVENILFQQDLFVNTHHLVQHFSITAQQQNYIWSTKCIKNGIMQSTVLMKFKGGTSPPETTLTETIITFDKLIFSHYF